MIRGPDPSATLRGLDGRQPTATDDNRWQTHHNVGRRERRQASEPASPALQAMATARSIGGNRIVNASHPPPPCPVLRRAREAPNLVQSRTGPGSKVNLGREWRQTLSAATPDGVGRFSCHQTSVIPQGPNFRVLGNRNTLGDPPYLSSRKRYFVMTENHLQKKARPVPGNPRKPSPSHPC